MPLDLKHERMIDRVAGIFKASGFETDRKVHVRFYGHQTEIDVCALFQEVLVIVECKTGVDVHFGNLLLDWSTKRDGISKAAAEHSLKVESSVDHKATPERLASTRHYKLIIVFDKYHPSQEMVEGAKREGVEILDQDGIEYYRRTSKALQKWTKYEMFREFGIQREEANTLFEVHSLKLKQPGAELFIFSLPPDKLLRIAYVHRRSLKETYAYQRLVNEARISKIGEFLKNQLAILPNAILVAFGPDITDKIVFTPSREDGQGVHGKLTIPMEYCSSWIIDGQHRLYGFTRTAFSEEPPEGPEVQDKFELLVVGLKNVSGKAQAKTFVDINDNQKRINPTLLLDLATNIQDLSQGYTWPSLLAKELNEREPWKGRIRIYEVERNKPITLAGFAKFVLAKELLKYRSKNGKHEYTGPLFEYAPFDYTKGIEDAINKRALERQVKLLARFCKGLRRAVTASATDRWSDHTTYGVTKATCVNASFLVLGRILEARPRADLDFDAYLKPLGNLSFENKWIRKLGGGWVGFRGLADEMITALNEKNRRLKLRGYD